jgi:hypothetical protein
MTGFQSPQLLTDLYRDLRDRRLLLLVVVLLVGLAVVPIALSSKSDTPPPAPPPPSPVAKKSNAPATEVVVSDPGVRDYRKRLSGDSAKDPFVQLFTGPISGGGSAGQTDTGTGGGTSGEATDTGSTGTVAGETAPSGGSVPQPQTESKYYFYRIKVRSGRVGEELKVRESVGALTPLPSKTVPAATFLGVTTDSSFKAETAVFLVSAAVSSVAGEGTCSFAGTQCQLLSLKPGQHEDFVWTDGLVYRVQLVKFDLISRNGTPSGAGGGDSGSGQVGSGNPSGRHFSF